ncbi:hypothetical protein ABID59_005966 [Bradyrhizobium sp. S3.3.6]|uniref:adenylate/guanylate cyclase domain-containing protein n=1 Tax=unclassified Bradyrhizobium TaxID=2631580 RepID=UPI0033931D41
MSQLQHLPNERRWSHLRVGIHTGPVISGVVGNRRITFDIWGDAVNTAWFMGAFGVAGRINVSETVAGHGHGLFELESRGPIEAKHERAHEMFFLNGLKKEYSPSQRCWLLSAGLPKIGKISQRAVGMAPWTALVRSDPIRSTLSRGLRDELGPQPAKEQVPLQ